MTDISKHVHNFIRPTRLSLIKSGRALPSHAIAFKTSDYMEVWKLREKSHDEIRGILEGKRGSIVAATGLSIQLRRGYIGSDTTLAWVFIELYNDITTYGIDPDATVYIDVWAKVKKSYISRLL